VPEHAFRKIPNGMMRDCGWRSSASYGHDTRHLAYTSSRSLLSMAEYMTTSTLDSDIHRKSIRTSWLDRPLSNRLCALGWFLATAEFVSLSQLLGGPTQVDANLSAPSTLAIAHVLPACAYPSSSTPGVAPLYPLVSGVFAWLLRVGNGTPFPSSASLGPHCSTAADAIFSWASRSGALSETILLGYLGWVALLFGVVALLRATGRGRCGWEVTAIMVLGCTPPILLVLREYFHPEDLLAIGLAFAGLACARRGQWIWAGVVLGLAVTSQQFALLVAAPLLVLAPRNHRIRYIAAVVAPAAIVMVGMLVITSGRVLDVLTGTTATPPSGGTLLYVAHLHGVTLLFVSRVLPIVLAMLLAWWSARRLGAAALDPVPLVSLIATSLCFRLVFEVNLFGYYFMAVSASLVVLNVVRGRIHPYLTAWIVLVSFAYDPLHWGSHPWTYVIPVGSYQLLLVPAAMALAVSPLISVVRDRRRSVVESFRDEHRAISFDSALQTTGM
jgi:hypothetical protein